MSKHTYDLVVPAAIGMRSYETENKAMRADILFHAGTYLDFGHVQRVTVNDTGKRDNNVVYVYRFAADTDQVRRIMETAGDKFGGAAVLTRIGQVAL